MAKNTEADKAKGQQYFENARDDQITNNHIQFQLKKDFGDKMAKISAWRFYRR